MEHFEGFRHLEPATQEAVQAAEQELGLHFANDYRKLAIQYGAVSAKGFELTGVTDSERLNVVAVTKAERERADIPEGMYVVENVGCGGALILQERSGAVYLLDPSTPAKYIAKSLRAYIEMAVKAKG